MARHYITSSGESKKYTPKEQKQITMRALGLNYDNPTDQKIYKSIYDDLTRRTRQYNILQDLSEDSKLRPADMLFDIAHARLRQGVTEAPTLNSIQTTIRQQGYNYSATVQNLYNQTLQANTRRFKERVQSSPQAYIEQAINYEKNVFSAFLNTRGVNDDYGEFNQWLNEPQEVYIDRETGEIVTPDEARGANGLIDLNRFTPDTVPRQSIIKDIKIVRDKLEELARDRKKRYKRVYTDRSNNVYHYEIRQA